MANNRPPRRDNPGKGSRPGGGFRGPGGPGGPGGPRRGPGPGGPRGPQHRSGEGSHGGHRGPPQGARRGRPHEHGHHAHPHKARPAARPETTKTPDGQPDPLAAATAMMVMCLPPPAMAQVIELLLPFVEDEDLELIIENVLEHAAGMQSGLDEIAGELVGYGDGEDDFDGGNGFEDDDEDDGDDDEDVISALADAPEGGGNEPN